MLEAIRQITSRAAGPGAAHRIYRRPVHARVVRDRRRALEQLRAHQGADVRRTRRLAPVLRPVVRRRRRLSHRADRSGRPGGPGIRFVGRRAERRRLPRVHPAALEEDLRSALGATTCRPFISGSARARFSASCARPAGRSSAPTGASRSTRRGRASGSTGRFRATSIRRCCSGRCRGFSRQPTRCWTGRAAGRATSSTSVTASCR